MTCLKETRPEVLLLVSVLGLVPDMNKIVELCNKYNVILLEDTCESMGSTYNGQKLGTFGLMSSFSTYFGHHISTIEGGIVSTNDEELYEILKAIRSHGWDRDAATKFSSQLREQWNTSDFDSLYTFYFSGFNLRSTDLQAYIGLEQIDKLEDICRSRNQNFKIYQKELSDYRPYILDYPENFISNFAYPVIAKNRNEIGKKELPNVSIIDKYGFYVPNHPGLSEQEILKITNIIKGVK